jgi:hypothetical protein
VPAHNVDSAYRLRGPLVVDALVESQDSILRRQLALVSAIRPWRETFRQTVPRQTPTKAGLDFVDMSRTPMAHDQAARILTADREGRFPLDGGCFIRSRLIKMDSEDFVLSIVADHLAFDGWSSVLFASELSHNYDSLLGPDREHMPPLPISAAEYASLQRAFAEEAAEEVRTVWPGLLSDAPVLKDLQIGRATDGSVPSGKSRNLHVDVSTDFVASLQRVASRNNTTLSVILNAALFLLMRRWTGERDLRIVTPMANREWDLIRPVIGDFTNQLVVPLRMVAAPSSKNGLENLVHQVHERVGEMRRYEDYPLELVLQALQPQLLPAPWRTRYAAINVMLGGEFDDTKALTLPGIKVSPLVVPSTYSMLFACIYLWVIDGAKGVEFELQFSPDLYDPAEMVKLLDAYVATLREFAYLDRSGS